MVQFKITRNKGQEYISIYNGNIFLQYLGKMQNITPEKLNYFRRKWIQKINLKEHAELTDELLNCYKYDFKKEATQVHKEEINVIVTNLLKNKRR